MTTYIKRREVSAINKLQSDLFTVDNCGVEREARTKATGRTLDPLASPLADPTCHVTSPLMSRDDSQLAPPPAAAAAAAVYDRFEECSLWVAFLTYVAYGVLVAVGYIKELLFPVHQGEKNREGYVPLFTSFESFYIRNVYRRMSDCFNLPLAGCPGGEIVIQERYSPDYGFTYRRNGNELKCVNFGSYNYLGFAENSGPCTDAAEQAIREYGVSSCSPRLQLGGQRLQEELEQQLAEFLGVEAALTFPMGFATNALNLPCLVAGSGCLVISDELNHASLILGLRLSGAVITVFKHNDMADLERRLRRAVVEGRPRTHRPWRKILVVVEGVYSMEGSLCKLPKVIELKNKYKAYLYLDEAHSIGAMGPTGRGMVEYWGCRPSDVDVLMGTFTKSFGAIGGYIAGSKRLVNHLRRSSHCQYYGACMPAPVAAQIISVLKQLTTPPPPPSPVPSLPPSASSPAHAPELAGDSSATSTATWRPPVGVARVARLAANTRYFRHRLRQLGFIVYGDDDSPVVPVLIYFPAKACDFVRELRRHGVAAVIVGFPATSLLTVRCRFCVSSSHTLPVLDWILDLIDKIGEKLEMKYSRQPILHKKIEYGNC